ncbi:hypothetical protein ACVWWO_000039 [Bradyrhizobium sp. F1.13.1]
MIAAGFMTSPASANKMDCKAGAMADVTQRLWSPEERHSEAADLDKEASAVI